MMVGLPLLTTTILPPLESPASLVGLEAASQARAAVESPARAAVERQESLVAAAAAPAPAGTALGTDPPHGDTVDGTQVLPPQASPARAVEDQASLARVAVEVASPARAAVEDA